MAVGFGETEQTARPLVGGRIGAIVALAVLALYVLFGIAVATHSHGRLGPNGAPLFYDFSAFYEAGQLAGAGHAASAYDDSVMAAMQQKDFPGATTRLPWNYPPSFQLLLTPLAALPYVAAWLAWSLALYSAYALLARQLIPLRHLWIALLAPAAAINILVGQNGLLSTVLIGAGVLTLERRPILGGVLLGLMSYKPHFAVMVPVVLLFARQWKALGGAIASGAVLALASLAAFGVDPWLAFVHKALAPAGVITTSSSDWRTVPSIQTLARTLGLPAPIDMALHGIVALAAAIGAVWVWRRTTDARLRTGALAAAALLVTPYLRLYDLALLILPLAALLPREGERTPRLEQTALAITWLLPALLLFAAPPIQVGALASVALLALVVRRTWNSQPNPTLTLQPA